MVFLWMDGHCSFLLGCLPFSNWLAVKFTLAFYMHCHHVSQLAFHPWLCFDSSPQSEVKILFSQMSQSFTLKFLILMSINRKLSATPNTLKFSAISPTSTLMALFGFGGGGVWIKSLIYLEFILVWRLREVSSIFFQMPNSSGKL